MGIYPMLPDESCWFLAVDFDGENWRDDTRAFLDSCLKFDVSACLERSRSEMEGMYGYFSISLYQPDWLERLPFF